MSDTAWTACFLSSLFAWVMLHQHMSMKSHFGKLQRSTGESSSDFCLACFPVNRNHRESCRMKLTGAFQQAAMLGSPPPQCKPRLPGTPIVLTKPLSHQDASFGLFGSYDGSAPDEQVRTRQHPPSPSSMLHAQPTSLALSFAYTGAVH